MSFRNARSTRLPHLRFWDGRHPVQVLHYLSLISFGILKLIQGRLDSLIFNITKIDRRIAVYFGEMADFQTTLILTNAILSASAECSVAMSCNWLLTAHITVVLFAETLDHCLNLT
jgi:hypothetical protein